MMNTRPPRTCAVSESQCHRCDCVVELPPHFVKGNTGGCPAPSLSSAGGRLYDAT